MPDHRIDAEALAETRQPLRAERDLGQQHQHLASGLNGLRDCLKVNFGLAGAGNPVKQGHREFLRANPFNQLVGGGGLVIRQYHAGSCRIRWRRSGDRHANPDQRALFNQSGDNSRRAARLARQFRCRARRAGRDLQHPRPCRGQADVR